MTEIILLLVGVVVGAMNSIAGGGMLFGFPVMMAVGMPAITANVTGHVAILPGQIGALIGYRDYLRKVHAVYLVLLIPLAVGAFIGASLLKDISPARFEQLIPVLLLLAVLLFAFQPSLHKFFHAHLKTRSKNIPRLAIIGAALIPLAIYGGFFGVGFGFILLAFLSFSHIHDIHRINALKNVGTFTIAAVTTATLFGSGLIDWRNGVVMAIGCGAGGYFGARIAQRFSSHAIRIVVIVIGVLSVGYLWAKY